MGFLKKLFGTAAIAGAAVGSVLYVKKRKDERDIESDIFEDFDSIKAFNINKSDDENESKVTVTINKRKVKNMADNAADKVIDATDKMKETVTEKVGEENIETVKEKIDIAKEKISDAADFAIDKANMAKDIIIEKVGEENIETAKEKVKEAAFSAKEKVSGTINKVIKPENDDDFEDEDLTEEEINLFDDEDDSDIETEDDVTVSDDDDFLADDLTY